MVHRLADDAVADLDDIWWRVAKYTGNVVIAQNTGLRGHPVGEYVIIYAFDGEDVVILRVFDGRSDFERMLR